MRANAPEREPQIQRLWQDRGTYEALWRSNPGPAFTLHDGPPYANGDLHIGHALNKILKDFVVRYQLLNGRRARLVPGWDTHGLPIELKVLQSLKPEERRELTTAALRAKAKDFALDALDRQRTQFSRYGVWADWQEPYVTLDPAYEAAQIGVFGRMALRGHIYRGRKPVHWSPSSRTALAEAELEYPEGHTSRSVYAALGLLRPGSAEAGLAGEARRAAHESAAAALPADAAEALFGGGGSSSTAALAVWTTTPWTLPANLAVAVNGDLDYAVVEVGAAADGDSNSPHAGRRLVVAAALQDDLASRLGVPAEQLKSLVTIKGSQLEGLLYRHPLYDLPAQAPTGEAAAHADGDDHSAQGITPSTRPPAPVVVGGDYITTESGTGLVHTAPGHGQEDYMVGRRVGLPLLSPVDDDGRFTADAGPELQGSSVLSDGNERVVRAMEAAGALLKEEPYGHKYPYDWRTKKPTIFRATAQWFASVEGFRADALKAIREVEWIPAAGEARITAMTEGRSDWCISRQRKWGVPIPVFYDKQTGEALLTEATIAHAQQVVRDQGGSDAWFTLPIEDLLPESLRHLAPNLVRGEDTMDVWFDSGSSWAGVLERTEGLEAPADLYLEGSDQHRGWFQSSLLTRVAATEGGGAPYKRVLTHGFVLDEKGNKMSKSLGNVVDPRTVIEGGKDSKAQPPYGADVLRLWVASVDYTGDVMIGPGIMRQVADAYRKLRGTLRFLLGNLSDYESGVREVVAVASGGGGGGGNNGASSSSFGSLPAPSELLTAQSYRQLPAIDRWMLARHADVMREVKQSLDAFQFRRALAAINAYVSGDLSAFYLDTAKERCYLQGGETVSRRQCQAVQAAVLRGLLSALGPVVPHTAEDAWQALLKPLLKGGEGGEGAAAAAGLCPSVFSAGWADPPAEWTAGCDEAERARWQSLLKLRAAVNGCLERARGKGLLGASLEARVAVALPAGEELGAWLAALDGSGNGADELRRLLLVSRVDLVQGGVAEVREALGLSGAAGGEAEDEAAVVEAAVDVSAAAEGGDAAAPLLVSVGVARAGGAKCARCWSWTADVGSAAPQEHPSLCASCTNVVQASGFRLPGVEAPAAVASR
jgi:isoleucyl-tRNA synthetase